MKYYANFDVNNGTRLMNSAEFTNKNEALKWFLSSAKGNHFGGTNPGRCWVDDENGNNIYYRVYCGSKNWSNYDGERQ